LVKQVCKFPTFLDFKAYTKIIVAGIGGPYEIVDLASTETESSDLPFSKYPAILTGTVGGLGFQNEPLICSGTYQGSMRSCYKYEHGIWSEYEMMVVGRAYSAITKSPFQNKSQLLFVTGGPGVTAEVLTTEGWRQVFPSLPVGMSNHCMTLLNPHTAIAIGGYQDEAKSSPNTFTFDTLKMVWEQGPTLRTGRYRHSCARITKDKDCHEYSIIAVGGSNNGSYLKSTEILDPLADEWREGPGMSS
jgi:hypothetical protein